MRPDHHETPYWGLEELSEESLEEFGEVLTQTSGVKRRADPRHYLWILLVLATERPAATITVTYPDADAMRDDPLRDVLYETSVTVTEQVKQPGRHGKFRFPNVPRLDTRPLGPDNTTRQFSFGWTQRVRWMENQHAAYQLSGRELEGTSAREMNRWKERFVGRTYGYPASAVDAFLNENQIRLQPEAGLAALDAADITPSEERYLNLVAYTPAASVEAVEAAVDRGKQHAAVIEQIVEEFPVLHGALDWLTLSVQHGAELRKRMKQARELPGERYPTSEMRRQVTPKAPDADFPE